MESIGKYLREEPGKPSPKDTSGEVKGFRIEDGKIIEIPIADVSKPVPEIQEYKMFEHKPLGSEEFEPKSYKELTAEGEARRERFRERVASWKSRTVENLGGSYIKAAYKAGKKAWTRTKEETSRFVWSVPELAEHSMEFYRHAPDIAKRKAGEKFEKVASSVAGVMERAFTSIPMQEYGFLPEAAGQLDGVEERATVAYARFDKRQSDVLADLIREERLNAAYRELLRVRQENIKLKQQLIELGLISAAA